MLTSKQRAILRGMSSTIDTIFQIGKGGIPDTLVAQVDDALRVRELVKIKILDNCMTHSAMEAGQELAEKTGAELVQVIGSKIILYKKNPKDPVIKLK